MDRETKKKLVIILDIVSAIVLAFLIYYVFLMGDTSPIKTDELSAQPDATILADSDDSPAEDTSSDIVSTSEPSVNSGGTYISRSAIPDGKTVCMIGDSRFHGMHQAVGDDDNVIWITKGGVGHDWYWQNKSTIQELDRDTVIIYELGVNSIDPRNGIKAINDLHELGFTNIYALSIGPVDEEKESHHGYHITDEKIHEYNEYLSTHLPYGVKYFDIYTPLCESMVTYDGLHYDDDTYILWYDIIINEIDH